jgi:hypothetical protein
MSEIFRPRKDPGNLAMQKNSQKTKLVKEYRLSVLKIPDLEILMSFYRIEKM